MKLTPCHEVPSVAAEIKTLAMLKAHHRTLESQVDEARGKIQAHRNTAGNDAVAAALGVVDGTPRTTINALEAEYNRLTRDADTVLAGVRAQETKVATAKSIASSKAARALAPEIAKTIANVERAAKELRAANQRARAFAAEFESLGYREGCLPTMELMGGEKLDWAIANYSKSTRDEAGAMGLALVA